MLVTGFCRITDSLCGSDVAGMAREAHEADCSAGLLATEQGDECDEKRKAGEEVTSLAKRKIFDSLDLTLDTNGVVWDGSKRYPSTTFVSKRHSLPYSAIVVEGQTWMIWKLLSKIWYENRLILTRSGSVAAWKADDTFVLSSVSSGVITDPEEIHLIWCRYCAGVPCRDMARVTGLVAYCREDFYSIVKDVVVGGIRG